MCTKVMYNNTIYQSMGRRFIDFSDCCERFIPSSLVQISLISALVDPVCFLASFHFLCGFRIMQRPAWALSLDLHLWEVCMSGILRRIQPHGYEAGTLGRILFNVVLDGCWFCMERGMPLMRAAVRSRLLRLALSASRTCWGAATKVKHASGMPL